MNLSFTDIVLSLLTFFIGVFASEFLKGLSGAYMEKLGRSIKGQFFKGANKSVADDYFALGRYRTTLKVLDGNGFARYSGSTLDVRLRDGAPDSPDEIADLILEQEIQMEKTREAGDQSVWDGIGIGIDSYNIIRDNDENYLGGVLRCYKSRYSAFRAIVGKIASEDPSDPTSIYQKYLKDNEASAILPYLARHVGIVAVVTTSDDKVVMVRRSSRTGIRQDHFDVSVVEGIEPTKDADASGEYARIDVFRSVARGCQEELGFTPAYDQIQLTGFAVDIQYYQFNFIAIVSTIKTFKELAAQRGGRSKDAWETRVLPLDIRVDTVLEFIRENKMWGFAVIALYWTLLQKFPRQVIDARANQILTTGKDC